MRKPLLRTAFAALVAAALAGCAVNQPAPPVLDVPAPTITDVPGGLLERWWTAFDDPVLTALIDEALASNLDLKATLARIELARAQVLIARADLYPSVNATAGAGRSKISGVGSVPLPPGTPLISNDYNVGIDLSFELDVWGKYRSGALAAQNDLTAARYYREATRITVAADVASTYFRLRAADAELALLRDTLVTRRDTLQLQRDRFDAGIIGNYDLKQAEAEVSQVTADIARAEQGVATLESALAVLTGRSPRNVWAPDVARGDPVLRAASIPALPAGLPSGVLERRPDIRRSEALLAASDLRITQARADYFPALSLTGAFGSESAALADLFTSPASVWRFGLALVQPIIGIKRVDAGVQAATARRDQALIEYQQTVQTAFREVHDSLVTHRTAREILTAEGARRDQLAAALEVARLRYEAGRTSFLEVLDAQRTLLGAETLRIAAARDARLSVVDFAKALGGGWSPEAFAAAQ
jgi:multidrug efflux system outer membrane protein